MKRRWIGTIAGLCIALSLAACGGGGSGGGTGGGTPSGETASGGNDAAMNLYKQNCLACHGNELQGVTGPSLQTVGGKYSKEQIVEILQQGRGRMPGFGNRLNADEIDALAAWLAEQK